MALWQYLWAGSGTTVGLYRLETSSADSSWNANNGSDTNITYGAWKIWAWSAGSTITGSSQISIPDQAYNRIKTVTISLWVKLNGINPNIWRGTLVIRKDTPTTRYLYGLYVDPNTWNIKWQLYSSGYTNTATYTLSSWVWVNAVLVITWGSWTIQLFINWKATWSAVALPAFNAPTDPITVSKWSIAWSNEFLNWSVDEIIIENVVWTQTKIQKQYTYAKWRFWII